MPEITVAREGRIASVMLPAASSPAAWAELESAAAALRDDDGVYVVLLASASSFSLATPGDAVAAGDVLRGIELLPRPVVAVIEGAASGAGLALALAADVRVAGAQASFSAGAPSAGLLGLGVTQRLPRIAGRGVAAQMLLLGEPVDAEAALRCGLVNAVAPAGGAMAQARALAERIAEQGPIAVRYAKEAIGRGLDMPLEQALRYETDLTIILQTTADRAEGVAAFLEKRRPRFEGR